MKWQSQKQEISALKENQRGDYMKWWKTVDLRDEFLCLLWSKMYGSTEQRIEQLYIIRDNLNLKKL